MSKLSDENEHDEDRLDFEDEAGDADVEWKDLPPEREFFATPYDPPVKALVQEMNDGELIVRPSFQRNAVWDEARQSRFIESILLNIPIPNLFFAEDDDQSKVVVDGQQRLTALHAFLTGRLKLKKLEVLAPLNGRRFDDLTPRQKRLFSNRTLRCLIISARSDSEIRFQVFERLNQGGMPLNAQEVRHCVYRGPLNDLLHSLSAEPSWLSLLGTTKVHPRMSDCELVLRYFALREVLPAYSPPLKVLLNRYMRDHRHDGVDEIASIRQAFSSTIAVVKEVFGDGAFRRVLRKGDDLAFEKAANRAVFDAQMLIMDGLDLEIVREHKTGILIAFAELCLSNEGFIDAVSRATADRSRLRTRLMLWRDALTSIVGPVPSGGRAEIPHD